MRVGGPRRARAAAARDDAPVDDLDELDPELDLELEPDLELVCSLAWEPPQPDAATARTASAEIASSRGANPTGPG